MGRHSNLSFTSKATHSAWKPRTRILDPHGTGLHRRAGRAERVHQEDRGGDRKEGRFACLGDGPCAECVGAGEGGGGACQGFGGEELNALSALAFRWWSLRLKRAGIRWESRLQDVDVCSA